MNEGKKKVVLPDIPAEVLSEINRRSEIAKNRISHDKQIEEMAKTMLEESQKAKIVVSKIRICATTQPRKAVLNNGKQGMQVL